MFRETANSEGYSEGELVAERLESAVVRPASGAADAMQASNTTDSHMDRTTDRRWIIIMQFPLLLPRVCHAKNENHHSMKLILDE
jgi:hypothetical protein